VRVAPQVEVAEIERLFGAPGGDIARAHQTAKRLRQLDVDEMRRMEVVAVFKKARLDARPEGRSGAATPAWRTRRRSSRRFALLANDLRRWR
jgi:hypothetical protein